MDRIYLLHFKAFDDDRIIAAAPTMIPLLAEMDLRNRFGTHRPFELIREGMWEAQPFDQVDGLYQIYAVPYRNTVSDVRTPHQRQQPVPTTNTEGR